MVYNKLLTLNIFLCFKIFVVFFAQEFDEAGYKYIVDGWKEKVDRVELGDQRWGLFYAEKP